MRPGQIDPLKVLCLHGYRQNAESSKVKLGALRKLLKKHIEFVFVTAPHSVPPLPDQTESTNGHGWWFCAPDKTFNAHTICDCSIGLNDSFELLEETFKTLGPFDGIFAFSQGAALAGMLPYYIKHYPETNIKFNFMILVAAFKSKCKEHVIYYEDTIEMPCLHVIGETDQVIEPDLSKELSSCFEKPEYLFHNGGHYVPSNNQYKQNYVDFLNKFSH